MVPVWQNGWQDVVYTDPTNPTYYTLNSSSINVTTTLQSFPELVEGQTENYLFIIPQPVIQSGEPNPCLEITYKLDGSNENTISIPVVADWQAGKKYIIKVRLGTSLITV